VKEHFYKVELYLTAKVAVVLHVGAETTSKACRKALKCIEDLPSERMKEIVQSAPVDSTRFESYVFGIREVERKEGLSGE
jgi:hypothetical protein